MGLWPEGNLPRNSVKKTLSASDCADVSVVLCTRSFAELNVIIEDFFPANL